MKKLFLLSLFVCCFTISASAQYYNEIQLYIKVGETIDTTDYIVYIHFDSDGNMYYCIMSKQSAQDKYANGTLTEYGVNKVHDRNRDYTISTNSYYVYSSGSYEEQLVTEMWYGAPYTSWQYVRVGTDYYAIEHGKGQLICWDQRNNSSEIRNKVYYKAIKQSDLKSSNRNYDFLN